jgi:hypothetical protein
MIHQILCDQVIEHRWIAGLLPSVHFLDDLFRGVLIHVTRPSSMTRQVSWSVSLARTPQVGKRHSFGVPRWPLDQLDAVSVWISEPGRPEVFGVVGRARELGPKAFTSESSDSLVNGIHTDHEVVEPARAYVTSRWITHKLEAHELIAGKLEHGQATELRGRHLAQHFVPEGGVERDRALQVRDP